MYSACMGCKYYKGVAFLDNGDIAEHSCQAFPDGIPTKYLAGEFHNKEINGFKYEPREGTPDLTEYFENIRQKTT